MHVRVTPARRVVLDHGTSATPRAASSAPIRSRFATCSCQSVADGALSPVRGIGTCHNGGFNVQRIALAARCVTGVVPPWCVDRDGAARCFRWRLAGRTVSELWASG